MRGEPEHDGLKTLPTGRVSGTVVTEDTRGTAGGVRALMCIAVVSALLVIPCWWQPSIPSDDLASHVYNAWLYTQLVKGELPGLTIVPLRTNVIFDVLLARLMAIGGPAFAERTAASIAVLTFFWGVVAFARYASDRSVWMAAPLVAIIAYGRLFHVGLFNFYLSVGLSAIGAALYWHGRTRFRLLALPLFAIAAMGHPIAVAWVAAVTAYISLCRVLTHRAQVRFFAVCVSIIVAGHFVLTRFFDSPWTAAAVSLNALTGLDELQPFGARIVVAAAASLMLIATVVVLSEQRYFDTFDFGVQLILLHALATALAPSAIYFPGWEQPLTYMHVRMTFLSAIVCCFLLCGARPVLLNTAAAAVAVLGFGLALHSDHRAFNRLQQAMNSAVRTLPQNSRVVGMVRDWCSPVPAALHMVDRACVGHCYSYGNYEPSSGHFRIVARGPNPYVLPMRSDVKSLEQGRYVVQKRDLPLYVLEVDKTASTVHIRPARRGEVVPVSTAAITSGCAVAIP